MSSVKKRLGPYPGVSSPAPNGRPADHDWEFAVCGDLTDKQLELEQQLIEVPRGSKGTIWFDSCGGSAYAGLALATIIRLRGLKVTGVVSGECSSAAIMPFAACEKRYVTKHSTLLFHPVRWQSDEDVRMEEALEWARHFKVMEQDMDELLAKLFPLDQTKLQEWTRPGKFVSGTELVEAGLAEMVDLLSGDLWSQMQTEKLSGQ
ncbi:ClpP family protease [Calycomorphotria hydatis]|uniref:ATP-dependent Clp protease proteolytic subunit n=1 Tax=Calycomorphotria hydatis TaxID=2528027 RepID=A0A517T4A4_9PLAN|nr:ATP-dependent Clp protease proteolytic subunit [Calycomorphotria hydatis]QDT63204.1 ATP-dependent Clp protease proteolytic subunit [Calycomorphotria hydatis]